jgi:hypothetical protein
MTAKDREISEKIGVTCSAVSYWRAVHHIPAVTSAAYADLPLPIIPINTPAECGVLRTEKYMDLYQNGFMDGEIARIFDVSNRAVLEWRERRGLKPHHMDDMEASLSLLYPKIEVLYFEGLNDQEISKRLKIHPIIVAEWRIIQGLPEMWNEPEYPKDEESLYCDGKFLEIIIQKPLF